MIATGCFISSALSFFMEAGLPEGGGYHNMLRVLVCAIHTVWMGFWVQYSLNKDPVFRQIFLKHGWVFQKLAKNCQKWIVFRLNSSKKWV